MVDTSKTGRKTTAVINMFDKAKTVTVRCYYVYNNKMIIDDIEGYTYEVPVNNVIIIQERKENHDC